MRRHFVLMLPVPVNAREEVVPGYDQHPETLQALIEFLARYGQVPAPQPQEDGPLGLVNVDVVTAEFFLHQGNRSLDLARYKTVESPAHQAR